MRALFEAKKYRFFLSRVEPLGTSTRGNPAVVTFLHYIFSTVAFQCFPGIISNSEHFFSSIPISGLNSLIFAEELITMIIYFIL